MRKIAIATLALAVVGFAADANAGQRYACPGYAMHNGGCYSQSRPTVRRVIVQRRFIAGYREEVAQRPVYETRSVTRTVISRPAPVAQPCMDCAQDMQAIYVGCVYRDGQQVWQYRATNGIVYNMTMQRRNEADKIRLLSNGQVTWVKA